MHVPFNYNDNNFVNNVTTTEEKALIESTLANGFARLRFPQPLEDSYRRYRHSILVPRSVTVGWYAIAIYLAYCWMNAAVITLEKEIR